MPEKRLRLKYLWYAQKTVTQIVSDYYFLIVTEATSILH